MNRIKFLCFLVFLFNSYAFSEILPAIFNKAPEINFPISMQRVAFDHLLVSSPNSVDAKWGSLRNVEFYEQMLNLHKKIMADTRSDLLSLNNTQWSQYKIANEREVDSWSISKLVCPKSVSCYLLSANRGAWIVLSKNDEMTDFQLVSAVQKEFDEQGNSRGRIASLDTSFSDANFEDSGIFCTEYITGKYDEHLTMFKRRITPEGKIESKEIEGGYTQCKAPW